MSEREPKPTNRIIEKGRALLRNSKNTAEIAGLYMAALSATPALLLASVRIRNLRGSDYELVTHEEGSFHDAFYAPGGQGYIPGGASVEIKGLSSTYLVKDHKGWAEVFEGNRGARVEPRKDGKSGVFLRSFLITDLDDQAPFTTIEEKLELEFFFETITEVSKHYLEEETLQD